MMFDNPKGYWIGFGIGFVIALIINTFLSSAFGSDFWRGVLISFIVISVSAMIGATFVGAKSERD